MGLSNSATAEGAGSAMAGMVPPMAQTVNLCLHLKCQA
jgi:hypothetical protein